jgi:hypothetical protein
LVILSDDPNIPVRTLDVVARSYCCCNPCRCGCCNSCLGKREERGEEVK